MADGGEQAQGDGAAAPKPALKRYRRAELDEEEERQRLALLEEDGDE